jgi:hypothetical protein
MNLKFWQWDVFKTRKALLGDKEKLANRLAIAQFMNTSFQAVLEANTMKMTALHREALDLFGAIALQHNGELLVKDEFIKMLVAPDSKLQVTFERNTENDGLYIRAMELPTEAPPTNEPKQE